MTKLSSDSQNFYLTIEDDGKGLNDYSTLEKDLIHSKGHIGLLSIKNDLKWLNGSFEILSKPLIETGTMIKIIIPIESSEDK